MLHLSLDAQKFLKSKLVSLSPPQPFSELRWSSIERSTVPDRFLSRPYFERSLRDQTTFGSLNGRQTISVRVKGAFSGFNLSDWNTINSKKEKQPLTMVRITTGKNESMKGQKTKLSSLSLSASSSNAMRQAKKCLRTRTEMRIHIILRMHKVQSTLVISNSLISNNRLSRSENLVPVLTRRSTNRQQNIVEKRRNCSLGAISPLFHNIFNISLT